ncbi:MAG: tetratricopeptide repeat protein [Methanoregulaceae archaeon]|nr:tetratricopeptide repeat protein [Methanoregulaceae archaeon]
MTIIKSIGAPSLEAQVLYRRALEMARQGRHDAAINVFRQIVMIAPNFTKALQELGNSLDSLGRYPEALAAYSRVLKIDPLNEGALTQREIVLKKNANVRTEWLHFIEKTFPIQKKESRVPNQSLINDLAEAERIQSEETRSSHLQTVFRPDSAYHLKYYGSPIC